MNREIKFRAEYKGKIYEVENIYFQDELITLVVGQFQKGNVLRVRIGEVNLMQSTGLFDKYGKEIYEGDLVEWKQSSGGILEPSGNIYICEIIWSELGEWNCKDTVPLKKDPEYYSNFKLSGSNVKIIGDIYQNPDLLP